jgi:cell division septal protein FtsQ
LFIKKTQRLIPILLSAALVTTLAYVLGWSSLLTVKEVKISGTQSISEIRNELDQRELSLVVGMRLARVDVRGIKSTLSNLDWLDTFSVERNWLSGKVTLTVIEKTGVAKALTENGATLYFDDKGELFKPVSKIQLSTSEKMALVDSEDRSSEDLLGVAQLLKSMPTELEFLLSNLRGISVGKSGYLNMRTQIGSRDVQINWGKAVLIDQKSRVLIALLELPENKVARNFDLSIPDSPIAS